VQFFFPLSLSDFWTTALLFVEWLLFTLISKLTYWIRNRKRENPIAFPVVEYLRTLFALYLFTFNNIMQTSLNVLNCVEVPMGDSTTNVVRNYPSVSCSGGSYTPLLIASIVYLIFYVLVIPIAVVRNLVAIAYGSGRLAMFSEVTKGITFPYHGHWYQIPWELWRLIQRASLVATAVYMVDLNQ
jgi:hypothetical protein